MRRAYPWLWFDADGTLFDWDHAEVTAFGQAFADLGTPCGAEYLETYRRINRDLWAAMERHEISPGDLKERRFALLAEELALECSPAHLSAAYVARLCERAELIDGALEVLDSLRARCRFAIVTNGLGAVQHSRISRSALRGHFAGVIVSEEVGAAKPAAAFFDAAFERLGHPPKSDVLLIGDSLSSDIRGGAGYGLDTCWFNPGGEPRPGDLEITYEIADLRELPELV